jgi:hypothetical protein
MPKINPDPRPHNPRADLYQTFVALCQSRATRWQIGDLELGEAVDWLQRWAREHQLLIYLGQDNVQAIMARAFAELRDDLNGWIP